MSRRGKEPKPMARILPDTLAELFAQLAPAPERARLLEVWPELVRAPAEPVWFADGRLVVLVPSPVWASALRQSCTTLGNALKARGFAVERVEVRVAAATPPGES